MNREEIRAKARLKSLQNKNGREDPRFKRVIGKFVAAGLLEHSRLGPYRGPVILEDILWASKFEKRLLELLPAVLIRRPSLVRAPIAMPEDLREVISSLRHGILQGEFRGVPLKKCAYWLERIGRKKSAPSLLKAFRFQPDDISRLSALQRSTGLNETEVLRLALKRFAAEPAR